MGIFLSVVSLVIAAVVLVYCVKLMLVYHRFNEQISDWSSALDKKMLMSIDSAARDILRDLDRKFDEKNNMDTNGE